MSTPFRTARNWPLGITVWLLSVQYFAVQIIVAGQWAQPFSVLHNTISDLGNTTCGPYRDALICSPLHTWMNLSFVALGMGMILGALLIQRSLRPTGKAAAVGLWCMVLAGIGTILVGLFPENTVSIVHVVGATLPFTLGNVALLLFSRALPLPRALRACALIFGTGALVSLALFFTHTYLSLGIGGTERLTAYPQTIWLIIVTTYLLAHRQAQSA